MTDLESATVAEQFKALLRIADALTTAGKPARAQDFLRELVQIAEVLAPMYATRLQVCM